MTRNSAFSLVCALAIGFAGGCTKSSSSSNGVPPGAYFHTQFQTESQFIVEAIISDLAEQIYFAAHHQLPEKKYFSVIATEKPGANVDAPVYELQIRLDSRTDVKMDLKIGAPIWSPDVYQSVAKAIADAVRFSPDLGEKGEDTTLLTKLIDGKAETIEQQNEDLSTALEDDFGNFELHEKAALLLGAFVLREHSGHFFEIRSPLSRITAHLVMAHLLRGADSFGMNGQVAEALLLAMMNDQAAAVDRLNSINTNDATVGAMVRALRARATGDYEPLSEETNRSPIEDIQCFAAMADYVSTPIAWGKLSDEQKQTIDYVRIANERGYSVEIGHQLLEISIPLETNEISTIYQMVHGEELPSGDISNVLNVLPEHSFSADSEGKFHVHIIGWGQWAMFFQRHLCHAIQQNFYLMNAMWGVPDEAKKFAAYCDETFGGLTLYPFVRRFDCTDVESYHKSVDDGFKVTVAMPQFVPADCWNEICYAVSFAPQYLPNSNPHINEWHNHNPPPDTDYDLHPRLDHPSLVDRSDALAKFEHLHELAPYDCRISGWIMKKKYNDKPTFQQAMDLYHDVMPYSLTALRWVAFTLHDQPKQYEEYMTRAAELDPSCYYALGDYAASHDDLDKAAHFYQKAHDADPDRVRASNYALWMVRYYLKHNNTDRAAQIASEAGMVYSFRGLEAQAVFFEETSNFNAAVDWFSKIEERYNDSTPLLDFCLRHKESTGDRRFDPELEKRMDKVFPKGLQKVAVADFKSPPADGVLLNGQSALMDSAGLKKGDVIVAVHGVQVHNIMQYAYERSATDTPEMELIVWQGDAYREIKSSPPNHKFGVGILNYPEKQQ